MGQRLLHVVLLLCLAPAWAVADDPAPADAADRLGARLEQIQQAIGPLEDFQARFEKQKFTPLLKKPLVSRGRVLAREGAMRWDTLEPGVSHTLIRDGEVRILYPDDRRMEVYPLDERFQELVVTPMPELAALSERFEVEEAAGDGGDGLTLQLTPRAEAMRKHLTRLTVRIDAEAGHVEELRIDQPGDERTVYRFSDVKVNEGLADDAFELDVPAGTRIVAPYGRGGE